MTLTSRNGGIVTSGGGPQRPTDATNTVVAHPLRPRDVADLAEIVARAASTAESLRIIGAGSWLGAGRPVHDGAHPLDLASVSGIIEYVPGDLTLTAFAGTPLSLIADATAANSQWLSLDPFGDPHGTLGATLATASTGPLATTVGHPRDVALGVEFVSGDGERVRGGGRVVKNVAGFDLVRLQIGAWGTLGVLSEATVRLRGRPEVDRTLAIRMPHVASTLTSIAARLRQQRFAPLAAELLDASLASTLGVGSEATLLLRLVGNEDSVAMQASLVATLGEHAIVPSSTWRALATFEPALATVLRFPGSPANVAATWQRARLVADDASLMHASLGRGTVRVVLTGSPDESRRVVGAARATGGCLVERAPGTAWAGVPPAAGDRLSVRLRQAFDPRGIFNPGILGAPHE